MTHAHADVCIRLATTSDAAFIAALAPRFVAFALPQGRRKRETLAAIRADIEHALRRHAADDRFFVATATTGPVGFVHLQLQRDFFSGRRNCHISDLAVMRGRDGHGIGSALLAHAQSFAKTQHCERVTLSVFPGNTRARALYVRSGFTPDLIRMAKRCPGSRGQG